MPPEPASGFTTGLVLAAGGSSRLGRPKQLLPFRDATLLEHVVATTRDCPFDELIVALGGSAGDVLAAVDLGDAKVVVNNSYGSGCSSSIAAALSSADPRWDTLVLMLGDQPGVSAGTVHALIEGRGDAPFAICGYDDGRGHPLAFGRELEPELASLHGDKAVWKLMDRLGERVVEVRVPGPVPPDVDTWADYEAVLAAGAR